MQVFNLNMNKNVSRLSREVIIYATFHNLTHRRARLTRLRAYSETCDTLKGKRNREEGQ
jgi:hypothetical protein